MCPVSDDGDRSFGHLRGCVGARFRMMLGHVVSVRLTCLEASGTAFPRGRCTSQSRRQGAWVPRPRQHCPLLSDFKNRSHSVSWWLTEVSLRFPW